MDLKKILRVIKRNPRRLLDATRQRITGYQPPIGKACITKLEIKTLQTYAAKAKKGIVEIGVLDGGTTREMALVADVPIYGIDPLIPDSMDKNLQGATKIIQHNMSFYKHFFFFQAYSYDIAKKWQKPFDFIFIDGDHRYTEVKKDAHDWIPLLTPGGYVAFHDAAPVYSEKSEHVGYDGPITLINELKKDNTLTYIETKDSLAIFQKK